ncbi:MAG: hypothetical protein AAFV71_00335 [Cyanobacteria bacterium J06633_8]
MINLKTPQVIWYGVYILFCIIGTFNAFYPTIASGFSLMQTDPGDTRLVHYFLEHSFQFLTNNDYIGDFFSPSFFYPYKNVLTFSENLFGSSPIYFLFRIFLSSDLSYQLWMITVCVLCFISFATLMRHYRASHVPTIIGAFLFAFGMTRIVKIAHQQLLSQFFTPLAFLFFWSFIKSPKNRTFALSLLFIYLQVLAGIYLGWFLIFTLIILAAIAYTLNLDIRKRLIKYLKEKYLAGMFISGTWALLMFALLGPYLKAKAAFGPRPYAEIESMLPRLSSWFLPAQNSLWWSLFSENYKHLPMAHEHHMFLGLLPILLTFLSIYVLLHRQNIFNSERAFLVKVCLLVALTIFIISLRLPNGWSIWRIVYEIVPGASAIRAVTRIWTIFYFYILVAVTLCLDSVLSTMASKRWRITALSILCIGCVLEQIVIGSPSFAKTPWIKEVAQIQKLMEKDCDFSYVSLEPKNPYWASQLSAMWAGIQANVPVINGYSGQVPLNYGDISKSMNTGKIINWLGQDIKGKLCVISQDSLIDTDQIISMYSTKDNTSDSGSWKSYQIQLPIPKIFSQEIKGYEISDSFQANSLITIPAIVKNTSSFLWSNTGKNPTNFSYRWLDSNGNLQVFDGDGERTPLPFELSPGESAAINAIIKTPPQPGKYTLILTMVNEHVAWFNDKQAPSPKFDVIIK